MGPQKAGWKEGIYTSNTWKVKALGAAALHSNPIVQEERVKIMANAHLIPSQRFANLTCQI
jgi:hypothetical protein